MSPASVGWTDFALKRRTFVTEKMTGQFAVKSKC